MKMKMKMKWMTLSSISSINRSSNRLFFWAELSWAKLHLGLEYSFPLLFSACYAMLCYAMLHYLEDLFFSLSCFFEKKRKKSRRVGQSVSQGPGRAVRHKARWQGGKQSAVPGLFLYCHSNVSTSVRSPRALLLLLLPTNHREKIT